MKNLSFNLKRGGLIAAMCSFLIIAQTITAQSLLFVDTPTPPSEMTSGQLSRYNKLTAPGLFSELRVVQFNELATVEQQGTLTVNVSGSACEEVTFYAVGVDYNSESNYMWYGRMNPKGESTCTDGELMFTKMPEGLIGDLRVGDESYSIIDLGGGKQVLGKIPPGQVAICGGAIEEDGLINDVSTEARSGATCDIRVLILGTASAMSVIPNLTLLANGAINKVNQTLLNSQIYPNKGKLVLVGIESTAGYFSETSTMTTEDAIQQISSNANAINIMNATGADIVVLYVNPAIMSNTDNVAGVAILGGRWAVVDFKAGDQNIVFAHEIGHNLRGNHETCTASDPGTGCLNNTGAAHAHTFTTGSNDKKRKTMIYSEARVDEIITHYSNPLVNFSGKPTGIAGERDNASIIRNFGCTAASHSTLFDDAFSVGISGPTFGCPNSYQTFYANVTGNGLGVLSYEWRKAIGGVTYGNVFSTDSQVSIQLPSTPNQMVSLKLTVTSSLAGTKSVTTYVGVTTSGCGSYILVNPPINEGKITAVEVYPNPSKGDITFQLTAIENLGAGVLLVYDQYGKVVRKVAIEEILFGNNLISENFDDLPTGLFSFIVRIDTETLSGKFTIVK